MFVIRKMGVAMMILGASAGCSPYTRLGEIQDIPAGAAKVEEMSEEFALPSDHPLSEIPAGTVMDDISGLDGCWGAYVGSDLVYPDQASVQFFDFDLETALVSWQGIIRGPRQGVWSLLPPLAYDIAYEDTYSLEIVGPDRVAVQLLTERSCTNSVIEGMEGDCGEIHEVVDDPVVEWLVTLDGDFVIGEDAEELGSSDDHPYRGPDVWIYSRFSCPE